MAETINMPKLGFDMAEGTLVRWVKQVGENINKGDVLAEIETDKATVEVESPASGVVLQHMVDQGTVVPVNAPIAVVGAAGEKVEAAPAKEDVPVWTDFADVAGVNPVLLVGDRLHVAAPVTRRHAVAAYEYLAVFVEL